MRPANLLPSPANAPVIQPEQDDEIRPAPARSEFAQEASEHNEEPAAAQEQRPLLEHRLDKATMKAANARPTGGLNRFHGRPSTITTAAVLGGRTASGRTALTNPQVGSSAYIAAEEGFTPMVAPRSNVQGSRFSRQGADQIGREMRTGQDRRLLPPLPGLPFIDGIAAQHAHRSLEDSIGKQMAAATLTDAGFDTHLATLFDGDVAGLNRALRQESGGTPLPLAEAVVLAHALFLSQDGRPGRKVPADLAVESLPDLVRLCRHPGAGQDGTVISHDSERILRFGAALSSSGTGMRVLEHLAGTPDGEHAAWIRKSMEMFFDTASMIALGSAAPGALDPTRAMAASARATAVDLANHGSAGLLGPMVPVEVRTSPYPDCHADGATRQRATENWAMRQGFRSAGPDSDLERSRAMLEEVTGKWVDRFETQAKAERARNVLKRLFVEWLLPPSGTPFTAAGFGAEYSHLQENPDYRDKFDRAIIAAAGALAAELSTDTVPPERAVALAVLRRWQAGMASKPVTQRPHDVDIVGVDEHLATTDKARKLLKDRVNLQYILDVCTLCEVATSPREDASGDIELTSMAVQGATRELRKITDDLKPVNPGDFSSVIEFLQQVAADQRSGATLRLIGGRTGGIDARLPVTVTAVISAGPAVRITYSDNKVLLFTQSQHGSELFLANSKTFATALGVAVGESFKFGEHGIIGSTQVFRMLGEITKAEGVRIRTVRKFTDAGAVVNESRNNDKDYHNALMADVVGLIGRHAIAKRSPNKPPGDLLDKLAAMDFEGENISVTYQRQQTTDLRLDATISASLGYVVGASEGATYEKTLFSGQSRVDQSGAMQRTVTIHGEASNWRQFSSLNVQIPAIPAGKRKDENASSTTKQNSAVGLTTGRLMQYMTNYGDDRLATHYRLVHMNKKSVDQLFYKEIYYGTTDAYEKGLRRNQNGWDAMIGANQVREHIAELRRLQGNRPWNHVARSRMRPEYIVQHEAATALLDMYSAAGRARNDGVFEENADDLRGFVACLLADEDPSRQVWVPIGLFSTENSTEGRPDRGLNFLAVNTAQSSAYGEREFLFRGAGMGQIAAAFAQVPATFHPVAPPLPLPAVPAANTGQPRVRTAQEMPDGTVSEVTPSSRGSMASNNSSASNRSRREQIFEPNLQAASGQFLSPSTADGLRRSGLQPREASGSTKPKRFGALPGALSGRVPGRGVGGR